MRARIPDAKMLDNFIRPQIMDIEKSDEKTMIYPMKGVETIEKKLRVFPFRYIVLYV